MQRDQILRIFSVKVWAEPFPPVVIVVMSPWGSACTVGRYLTPSVLDLGVAVFMLSRFVRSNILLVWYPCIHSLIALVNIHCRNQLSYKYLIMYLNVDFTLDDNSSLQDTNTRNECLMLLFEFCIITLICITIFLL